MGGKRGEVPSSQPGSPFPFPREAPAANDSMSERLSKPTCLIVASAASAGEACGSGPPRPPLPLFRAKAVDLSAELKGGVGC